MNSISANLNIMIKASEKASRALIRDFGEVEKLQVSVKGPSDFVSNADTKAEKIIINELSKTKKNYSIISEEGGQKNNQDSENVWIIDPIDGTTNFIHGIPHVAIVIAKMVNNEITDGIVYNPILNEFYWSSLGRGSWCNNKRLRVSKRHELTNCVIGTGIPFGNRVYQKFYSELDNISKKTAGVRRLGSAALDLAYVSSGKIDGFWERDLNLWDICSGVLLVKEAGGKISEPDGNKWTTKSRDIIVSNTLIHNKLIENLTLL